ncbi:MAG: hypothetical protein HY938_04595 [Nitrosomonadales bacterium]|nr:hypothetical protein [Nitrosomonadales bacterium]
MNMFKLLKLLALSKVDFVLVGGLAVALRGYSRFTMDAVSSWRWMQPICEGPSERRPKRDCIPLFQCRWNFWRNPG